MTDETIEVKIHEHDKKLEEHEGKLNCLEKSDIKQDDSLNLLCSRLDRLISLNNKLFYGLITGMAGLIIKLYFFH